VLDSVLSRSSSKMSKSHSSRGKKDVGIIVDSDEDEIFDDEDEDEGTGGGDGGNTPSASLDYRDMLSSGADATRKVKGSKDKQHKDHSESEADDDEDDATDSEDDKGGKGNGSDSGEDYTDDEDEGEDAYRPGGYHPVKVGEVYNQRYVAGLLLH
jgi:hypothetical protein